MEINEKTTRREWYQIGYKDGKRETTREIIEKLFPIDVFNDNDVVVVWQVKDFLKELAKEYGVEVTSEKNQN